MTAIEHRSTDLIELRQYLLHAGQRDTLIDVFDRELVEPQEAVGMDVLGQFRDPQRPDYFVWFRGFPDMTARHESLTAFYDGPVWAKHRDVANATMIDSDNEDYDVDLGHVARAAGVSQPKLRAALGGHRESAGRRFDRGSRKDPSALLARSSVVPAEAVVLDVLLEIQVTQINSSGSHSHNLNATT